jgi:hypothetical protein
MLRSTAHAAIERMADQALAGNTWARGDGFYVVADVLVIERAAQGHEPEPTWKLRRPDGRTAYVYRDPEPAAPPVVPVSPEVIAHHTTAHAEQCPDGGYAERTCPCGDAVALVCTDCSAVVFVALRPGTAPCAHAQALMGGAT